jgi:predicted nucleic acid-binding Zn ribbon protein
MVSEDSILDVVERHRSDIDGALRALVKEANRGGGQDNITVVAFEIAGGIAAHDGDTREQALPVPDDEETLDEADAVPVVDTAVVSVDEIEAEGKSVRRRQRRRRMLAWLAILLLLAAVAVVLYLGLLR